MTNTLDTAIYDPYWVDYERIKQKYIILKRFGDKMESLPPSFFDVFFHPQMTHYMTSYAENYRLNEQQSADLSRTVRSILFGDVYIGDMPAVIQQKLGIDKDTAGKIAGSLVQNLFKPAMEDIKKMQMKKFGDRISGKGGAHTAPQTNRQPPTVNLKQDNTVDLSNN